MKKNITPVIAIISCTLALVIMAVSGINLVKTQAVLSPGSAVYEGEIEVSGLDVYLIENGQKATTLLADVGNPDPGKTYDEVIKAGNNADAEEFVRCIVTTSWKKGDAKATTLSPEYIELFYGDEDYNSSAWTLNKKETTAERKVYYLNKALEAGKESEALFDSFRIAGDITKEFETVTTVEDGVSITRVIYEYDGVEFDVSIEVQSVQVTSGQEAVLSVWGVENVTVNGNQLEVSE